MLGGPSSENHESCATVEVVGAPGGNYHGFMIIYEKKHFEKGMMEIQGIFFDRNNKLGALICCLGFPLEVALFEAC